MASIVVDRRAQTGKSAANRQRALNRLKRHLKQQVDELVLKRKLPEMDRDAEVEMRHSDVSEPSFVLKPGAGQQDRVVPGNDRFSPGQRIPKQGGSGGSGSGRGSESGEQSEDSFRFMLSRKEFLDLLFDDLRLPSLVRSMLVEVEDTSFKRGGVVRAGTPSALSVQRTFAQSIGRRVAARSAANSRREELVEQMYRAQQWGDAELAAETARKLREQHAPRVPFLDPVDLRFRSPVQVARPAGAAVMFCLMDVSGSMDEDRKDLAKRFFTLLYLFLLRKHDKVELVFIRHTEDAEECDEETFFHDPKTGGTVVMSALRKMQDIIDKRYAQPGWTVFAAQASDGDSWGNDAAQCVQFLREHVLPRVRYYVYAQTLEKAYDSNTPLWRAYSQLREQANFDMAVVSARDEVYPALARLFSQESAERAEGAAT